MSGKERKEWTDGKDQIVLGSGDVRIVDICADPAVI